VEGLWKLPLHAILAEAQRLRDERGPRASGKAPLRIAVLGGFSTQFITRILEALLIERGLDPEIYEAPYDTYVEHILNPESELYRFQPALTLLLVHRGDVRSWPLFAHGEAEVEAMARAEVERWAGYWQLIRKRLGTQIIQSNFELPDARVLGNFEAGHVAGELSFVRRLNVLLAAEARGRVQVFDADYLCASYGLSRALDPSRYHLTKQPFAFEFLPSYCHALAALVGATQGFAKKCVVLDLDDTLWGGTVGEDGLEGLELGPGHAAGEAFAAFQRYLQGLRARGVLLAVCSKNDDHVARAGFGHHGMVLKLDDIACFVANWETKAENLAHIARSLNIGLDSLVFVDNSPEERHLVRMMRPEVTVVELSDDPADYVRLLDEGRFFETTELTADAMQRTDFMRADQERSRAEAEHVDYASYLRSLQLKATVSAVDAASLPRVAELIKRTNQFNLRTVRHSPEQVKELVSRPGALGFSVAVSDRFGSQGTVAVALAVPEGDALFVDTWLMSCRVLKRGVEQAVFELLLRHARASGVRRLVGEFRPSGKNAMVQNLYAELGFRNIGESPEGVTRWELLVSAAPAHVGHHLEIVDG
jgi:FkbH-like protein